MITSGPNFLGKIIQEAQEIKDDVWYDYLLKKGLFGYTLRGDEFSVIIDGSVKTAESLSLQISQTIPEGTPIELSGMPHYPRPRLLRLT